MTRKWYSVPSRKSSGEKVRMSPLTFPTGVQLDLVEGLDSIMYFVIGVPPSLSGGFQVNVTEFLVRSVSSIGPIGRPGFSVKRDEGLKNKHCNDQVQKHIVDDKEEAVYEIGPSQLKSNEMFISLNTNSTASS